MSVGRRKTEGFEIGTRVGKRVIEKHIMEKGRTKCVVRCECGRVDVVSMNNLKVGKASQCCECSRKQQSERVHSDKRSVSDLTGKVFGRWTVVSYEDVRTRRGSHWLCKCACGKEKVLPARILKTGKSKSCGCITKEKKKCIHTGKPFKSSGGYMRVYRPEHPNADVNGSIPEHVYIMSKYLDRPLFDDEVVHHKNGKRDDNRISNLELWTRAHPSGQRVDDMIDFCESYLRRYKPSVLKGTV